MVIEKEDVQQRLMKYPSEEFSELKNDLPKSTY
jgi:hypothetical protein